MLPSLQVMKSLVRSHVRIGDTTLNARKAMGVTHAAYPWGNFEGGRENPYHRALGSSGR